MPMIGLLLILSLGGEAQEATERNVEFKSQGLVIKGTMALPIHEKGKKLPAYVLVHGSGAHGRDAKVGPFQVFRKLSDSLVKKGAIVLRYDKRTFLLAQIAKKTKSKLAVIELFRKVVPDDFIKDAQAAFDFLLTQPEVDPKDITVVGHSQGGSFGPVIAKDRPFARIVLLAPGIQRLDEGIRYQGKFQIEYFKKLPNSEKLIANMKKTLEYYERLWAILKDDSVPEDQYLFAYGASKRFYTRWMKLTADFESEFLKVEKPTLVIQGEKDFLCVADVLKKKEKRFRTNANVKIVYIPNMAHDLHDVTSKKFNAKVADLIWDHR